MRRKCGVPFKILNKDSLMGPSYNEHLITKVWRQADVLISRKKKNRLCKKSFLFGLGKHAVLLCWFVFAVDQSSWVLFRPILK